MISFIDAVEGFHGDYEFLSNFYPSVVEYEGIVYPTVEHAYQAAKTLSQKDRIRISQLKYPGQAKKAGRTLHLRDDWEQNKIRIMEYLLRKKFTGYHDLSQKLFETGDKYLEETNYWNDTFWGVCNGKGSNVLGNLLMKIREDIKRLYVASVG